MKRLPLELSAAEIEALFAVEREILPEPSDVRNRAMKRARAAPKPARSAWLDVGNTGASRTASAPARAACATPRIE